MTRPSRLLVGGGWFVLWDEFRGDRYAGPVRADLERWTGDAWLCDDAKPLLTGSRILTYPNLGRRREPWNFEATLYRVRIDAHGYRALYPADRDQYEDHFDAVLDAREFIVPPYDDLHPPAQQDLPEPELLRLVPAITFAYPPGTRLVRGIVRRHGGPGLGGVLVQARSEDQGLPGSWRERTVTDADGAFRLALRWRGQVSDPEEYRPRYERFTLAAYESPGRSGHLDIRLDRLADQPGSAEPIPYVIEVGE